MSLSGISIEPMRPEHIESFQKALDTVSQERIYLSRTKAPSLEDMRAFVLDNLARNEVQVVALFEGVVVGWCDIRRLRVESHAHRGTLGMGILPDFREKGLGTRLISAALETARERGLHRVELDVHADNERAIALYEKVGFRAEGRARDAVRIDGQFIDSIPMAVIFSRSGRGAAGE